MATISITEGQLRRGETTPWPVGGRAAAVDSVVAPGDRPVSVHGPSTPDSVAPTDHDVALCGSLGVLRPRVDVRDAVEPRPPGDGRSGGIVHVCAIAVWIPHATAFVNGSPHASPLEIGALAAVLLWNQRLDAVKTGPFCYRTVTVS